MAFDSAEFAHASDGILIHVLTSTSGHTIDGIRARFEATKDSNGLWNIEAVSLDIAAIDVAEEE